MIRYLNKEYVPAFFFILANILSILSMFYEEIRAGALISFLCLIYLLVNYSIHLRLIKQKAHLLFTCFVIWELVSLLNYILNPDSIYLIIQDKTFLPKALSYLLIPQLFFYSYGFNTSRLGPHVVEKSNNIIIILNAFIVTTGIFLYFLRPDFYIKFQERALGPLFDYYHGYYPRLMSYIGSSMVVGNISAVTFALTLFFYKGRYKILLILLFTIGIFLSLQRSSLLCLFVTVFIYFYTKVLPQIIKYRIQKKHLLYIYIVSIAFIITIISTLIVSSEAFTSFLEEFYKKMSAFSNAVGEREGLWYNAFSVLKENPLGSGLGSLSHKASGLNDANFVPDGNFFRILGELSIPGLILFLLLTARPFFKRTPLYLRAILIVFFIQAIGTNVFDLYYSSFMFWYFLSLSNSRSNEPH